MVERYVRDVEVAGSNPVTSTRLSLDAIRVPGSAISFALPLALVAGSASCHLDQRQAACSHAALIAFAVPRSLLRAFLPGGRAFAHILHGRERKDGIFRKLFDTYPQQFERWRPQYCEDPFRRFALPGNLTPSPASLGEEPGIFSGNRPRALSGSVL